MACNHLLMQEIGPGTRAVVVGGGSSGRAAARLLRSLRASVRLLEKDPSRLPEDFQEWAAANRVRIVGGEHNAEQFAGCDVLVPSPGVPVKLLRPLLSEKNPPEIMAETELAWRQLEGEPILAVTGTSGKTTTTSLCAAMLAMRGLDVFTGGNIGTPLSEYVLDRRLAMRPKADALVLELSSFQLQTTSTFQPKVALLLNISENHLDYHKDMAEYIEAKMRLFRCQDEGDEAIFGLPLKGLPERFNVKARIRYFDPAQRPFPDSALIGGHNQANAEAAWQACRLFGVTRDNAAQALRDFAPLANRLEAVGSVNGTLYVNDSKCTTVDAMRVALQAFDRPLFLLAGGKFKGGDLKALAPLLRDKVKGVLLYGASREIFEEAWSGVVPLSWDETLRQALARAAAQATPGDVVLLAPATASYDQYPNYMKRGDDFRDAVRAMPAFTAERAAAEAGQ